MLGSTGHIKAVWIGTVVHHSVWPESLFCNCERQKIMFWRMLILHGGITGRRAAFISIGQETGTWWGSECSFTDIYPKQSIMVVLNYNHKIYTDEILTTGSPAFLMYFSSRFWRSCSLSLLNCVSIARSIYSSRSIRIRWNEPVNDNKPGWTVSKHTA